jgi:hypothetical protein
MTDAIANLAIWRRALAWLAVAGLLSNSLLPVAAMSIAVGPVGFGICSAASAGSPLGKAKPGLLVHHCPLCAEAAALPPGPHPGALFSHALSNAAHSQPRAISLATLFRHGRVQARAPPFVA